ncbi:MAG: TIGR01440 family protein [Lachnospiraceae bacterium]|nr:TIGR01440 family protein [Lachnospiraceae bacterium]
MQEGYEMMDIYEQAKEVFQEVKDKSASRIGNLMVIGCSTSTLQGDKPGTNSSEEIADSLYKALEEVFDDGTEIAVQCCEHLNRALVVERAVAKEYGLTIVNAVPHRKAGGAFATKHYHSLKDPVVVEELAHSAAIGIDIGGVMIGMHMKPVVVPAKLDHKMIGEAIVIAGISRYKYIGGERTRYDV